MKHPIIFAIVCLFCAFALIYFAIQGQNNQNRQECKMWNELGYSTSLVKEDFIFETCYLRTKSGDLLFARTFNMPKNDLLEVLK